MQANDLSIEQLAGQRLMVGFDGTELTDELKLQIDTMKVGGVILFARNIETPSQVRRLCFSIQDYARFCGQPPLFIAVDQEGGVVARLKAPFTEFPGNPAMRGPEDAIEFAEITAKELTEVGFNMNMAPVMDVAPEGFDSVNTKRIFGHDPAYVAEMGCTVIRHFQKNGLMAVAKHFPGIGRTILDSHHELPTLDSPLAEMEAYDLIPFRKAIENRAAGIMLSHIRYSGIDPDWPASLSKKIAGDLLREQFGYSGLVITDDLDMGAIAKHYDINTIIQQLMRANVDIALICHPGPNIEAARDQILQSMRDNAGLYAEGLASVARMAELKNQFIDTHDV
jgi:beta-N-acetylhexosaminidase